MYIDNHSEILHKQYKYTTGTPNFETIVILCAEQVEYILRRLYLDKVKTRQIHLQVLKGEKKIITL